MNLSFFVAFVLFLIGALAGVFEWDLGELDPTIWGLTFLALGHLRSFEVPARFRR